jgi:leucyl-tRNA synthetase
MEKYNPEKIEGKWRKEWEKSDIFRADDKSEKPKYYVLVEFPYPSGDGLHVGHARPYIALDILARKKRMDGFNVLFPMGWDAFGLPTENYAIKTGIHPAIATKKNTDNFKNQQKNLGLSFDWNREINTADPSYYKWTQWIFIQLFKNGLAYKDKIAINWCPRCKIGLANEEAVNSVCERCGEKVVKKEKEQWMLRITKYADRLIDDLDKVDYPEKVKISQKEWIGKSQGAEIKFNIITQISDIKYWVDVFTTRPDTLFGCTYLVLAPEHPLIEKLKDKILNYRTVEKYIKESKNRMDKDRLAQDKAKIGVELKGIKAVNPVNNRKIPIFIADYVLMQYGTGAIMAVPVHDQRDFDFAKKYNLAMIEVINSAEIKTSGADFKNAYEGEGILINSGRFTGMKSKEAKKRIVAWLANKGLAKEMINYKLRDWVFSRQRYWGEPIPMIKCKKCGWQPVPEKDLPVELPKVKNYKPSEKGESPLEKAENWVKTICPKCGAAGRRETDVMPNWAGSNWYYLRYCDPKNDKKLADPKLLEYWMPVDWYNGGMEHTTLHLLYSRFIYKFLWDIKAVPKSIGLEPYKKRTSHGVILGPGGIKMSKSKGNVINPDKIVKEYGADTLRVYEMFMGPFEQMIPWDVKGFKGVKRFLEKVWKLQYKVGDILGNGHDLEKIAHRTIKKVTEDIESLKFNTAISSLMVLLNFLEKEKELCLTQYSSFLILLSPFAPHLAEELWERANLEGLCCSQDWVKYNYRLIEENKVNLIIQVNGKVRDKVEVEAGISEAKAKKIVLAQEKVLKWIENKKIKKTIFVKDKIINFVI